MTQLDIPVATIPPRHRHLLETPRRGVPLVVWPLAAMGVMLPMLIVLVMMLLT